MSVEPAAAAAGERARVRARSGKAGGRGETPDRLRAGSGGVLSVDDDSRDAGLSRVVPRELESEDGGGVAGAFPPRCGAKDRRSLERSENSSRVDHRDLSRDGFAGA